MAVDLSRYVATTSGQVQGVDFESNASASVYKSLTNLGGAVEQIGMDMWKHELDTTARNETVNASNKLEERLAERKVFASQNYDSDTGFVKGTNKTYAQYMGDALDEDYDNLQADMTYQHSKDMFRNEYGRRLSAHKQDAVFEGNSILNKIDENRFTKIKENSLHNIVTSNMANIDLRTSEALSEIKRQSNLIGVRNAALGETLSQKSLNDMANNYAMTIMRYASESPDPQASAKASRMFGLFIDIEDTADLTKYVERTWGEVDPEAKAAIIEELGYIVGQRKQFDKNVQDGIITPDSPEYSAQFLPNEMGRNLTADEKQKYIKDFVDFRWKKAGERKESLETRLNDSLSLVINTNGARDSWGHTAKLINDRSYGMSAYDRAYKLHTFAKDAVDLEMKKTSYKFRTARDIQKRYAHYDAQMRANLLPMITDPEVLEAFKDPALGQEVVYGIKVSAQTAQNELFKSINSTSGVMDRISQDSRVTLLFRNAIRGDRIDVDMFKRGMSAQRAALANLGTPAAETAMDKLTPELAEHFYDRISGPNANFDSMKTFFGELGVKDPIFAAKIYSELLTRKRLDPSTVAILMQLNPASTKTQDSINRKVIDMERTIKEKGLKEVTVKRIGFFGGEKFDTTKISDKVVDVRKKLLDIPEVKQRMSVLASMGYTSDIAMGQLQLDNVAKSIAYDVALRGDGTYMENEEAQILKNVKDYFEDEVVSNKFAIGLLPKGDNRAVTANAMSLTTSVQDALKNGSMSTAIDPESHSKEYAKIMGADSELSRKQFNNDVSSGVILRQDPGTNNWKIMYKDKTNTYRPFYADTVAGPKALTFTTEELRGTDSSKLLKRIENVKTSKKFKTLQPIDKKESLSGRKF